MFRDSGGARDAVVAVREIISRAADGADHCQDYLGEIEAILRPSMAEEVLTEARAILMRWKDGKGDQPGYELLDEMLALMGGPKATEVAADPACGLESPDEPAAGRTLPAAPELQAPHAADGASGTKVGQTVSEVERDLIIETLDQAHGNRTRAATTLGISLRTLRNKINHYAHDGVAVPGPEHHRSVR